ncbi:tetratricopeptide repeat protein [Candidatus Poribacteria bacterium]|nr:tetratricopeptide repeat protein [Candidatus Poribacteria bacterium]MYB02299.1 tetratricopeptide repeat protein [Candidatus Poribacteria bacterium]
MKTFSPTSVRYALVSCTLYFLLFSTVPLSTAAESAFADSLFQQGDYLNAAHEYKRLLFLHPDTPQSDFIAFRVAASYQNAGKLKNAIPAYQLLIDTYPESSLVARCKNNIAQCHILLGNSKHGLSSLKQFLAEHAESDLAPRAHFTIGMVHIDKREWIQARQVWSDVSLTYPESPFAEVSNRLARQVKDAENLPRRSPTLAGVLSAFVPGSGQIYTGRTVDGLYAFVSVAVLGGASFYYADQGRYKVAVPVGILGAFFYGNSIYQGIQTARTFNGEYEKLFRNKLQQEIRDSGLFGAIPSPTDEVKFVLWQSRF